MRDVVVASRIPRWLQRSHFWLCGPFSGGIAPIDNGFREPVGWTWFILHCERLHLEATVMRRKQPSDAGSVEVPWV